MAVTFTPVGDEKASAIPDLKVTDLKICDSVIGDLNLSTMDGEKVSITGSVATINSVHEVAEVESSDMTADGAGVFNEKGEMPVIVWVLIALIVLGIILTFWMASKRGVFSRRK